MRSSNKLKIINDPIYGFISIPNETIYDLIAHPYFQRLRRISQMGLAFLVYPGAHHTRFHHALGCMHLMQRTVGLLRMKNVQISDEEEHALYAAILLHDIGHGPYSHAMEHSVVSGVEHEHISLLFIQKLNEQMGGRLDLAIEIFSGNYHRPFLLQLIAGELDMDRLDYLKRDSFFTGVAEGNVNSERLITMLNVKDDQLVIEEKGIYSAEKFLLARRLMYWQVYLHKTSLAAEQLLIRVLRRAKELAAGGHEISVPGELNFFLHTPITIDNFTDDVLHRFAQLDNTDVMMALKLWCGHEDRVLSELCCMIMNRNLPRIKLSNTQQPEEKLEKRVAQVMKKYKLTKHEASYLAFRGSVSNLAYNKRKPIRILKKSGKVVDLLSTNEHLVIHAMTQPIQKFYLAFPKSLD